MVPSPPGIAVGSLITGKYRVERHIGVGGMGIVVAARHEALNELFAIKVMLDASDEKLRLRFLREAQAAARIRSPHVAKVFDVGQLEDGAPFMVMELLRGEDLDAKLDREGPLGVTASVDYMLQSCDALGKAHALGIVHRDVKPANLFLVHSGGDSELIKLLDFGISKNFGAGHAGITKLTQTGSVLGSPQFMAPEQLVSSGDVDVRADIWSLGATLFELLTTEPAFDGETMADLYAAILGHAPRRITDLRPDVPAALDTVIQRCLQKHADDRYGTVAELATALAPFGPVHGRSAVARFARRVAPIGQTMADVQRPDIVPAPTTAPNGTRPPPIAQQTLAQQMQADAWTGAPATSSRPPEQILGHDPRSLGVASAPTASMDSGAWSRTHEATEATTCPLFASAVHPGATSLPAASSYTSAAPRSLGGATPKRGRHRGAIVVLLSLCVTMLAVGAYRYYAVMTANGVSASRSDNNRNGKRRERKAPTIKRRTRSPLDTEKLDDEDLDNLRTWLARAERLLAQERWGQARSNADRVLALIEDRGFVLSVHDSPAAANAYAIRGDASVLEEIALLNRQAVPNGDGPGIMFREYAIAQAWDRSGKACIIGRLLERLRELSLAPHASPPQAAVYSRLMSTLFASTNEKSWTAACRKKIRNILDESERREKAPP